jgi:hypothetical protein
MAKADITRKIRTARTVSRPPMNTLIHTKVPLRRVMRTRINLWGKWDLQWSWETPRLLKWEREEATPWNYQERKRKIRVAYYPKRQWVQYQIDHSEINSNHDDNIGSTFVRSIYKPSGKKGGPSRHIYRLVHASNQRPCILTNDIVYFFVTLGHWSSLLFCSGTLIDTPYAFLRNAEIYMAE